MARRTRRCATKWPGPRSACFRRCRSTTAAVVTTRIKQSRNARRVTGSSQGRSTPGTCGTRAGQNQGPRVTDPGYGSRARAGERDRDRAGHPEQGQHGRGRRLVERDEPVVAAQQERWRPGHEARGIGHQQRRPSGRPGRHQHHRGQSRPPAREDEEQRHRRRQGLERHGSAHHHTGPPPPLPRGRRQHERPGRRSRCPSRRPNRPVRPPRRVRSAPPSSPSTHARTPGVRTTRRCHFCPVAFRSR